MAALISGDVTLTVEDRQIVGKQKRNRVKIVFGDGSDTYPSGGVPMPTFSSWGMSRNLDYVILFDANDAVGQIWKWDYDNATIRGYEGDYAQSGDAPLAELDTSDTVAAQVLYGEAVGW